VSFLQEKSPTINRITIMLRFNFFIIEILIFLN